MSTILPITEMRTPARLLRQVAPDAPVFLTRKGHGGYVLLDINDYHKQHLVLRLLRALAEGEISARTHGTIRLPYPTAREVSVTLAAQRDLEALSPEAQKEALHGLRALSHFPEKGEALASALLFPSDCLYQEAGGQTALYRLLDQALCVIRLLPARFLAEVISSSPITG